MPVAVVKLGSSVVAQESGELRLSVVARVCEEIAALRDVSRRFGPRPRVRGWCCPP